MSLIELLDPPMSAEFPPPSDPTEHMQDLDAMINARLVEYSDGAMCIGSSTGEIRGLAGRLAAVREQSGIGMCIWGAFVK